MHLVRLQTSMKEQRQEVQMAGRGNPDVQVSTLNPCSSVPLSSRIEVVEKTAEHS